MELTALEREALGELHFSVIGANAMRARGVPAEAVEHFSTNRYHRAAVLALLAVQARAAAAGYVPTESEPDHVVCSA